MNYGLSKHLVLLALTLFTIANLFWGLLGGADTMNVQVGFAVVYFVLSLADHIKRNSPEKLPSERFRYLPYGIISLKTIKLVAFGVSSVVFYLMGTKIMQLSGVLLIIVIPELVIFVYRLATHNYFIAFFNNYVLLTMNEDIKIPARQVSRIECRYQIIYLTLKNDKVQLIELEKLPQEKQQLFMERFLLWAECNQLEFTMEAREALHV